MLNIKVSVSQIVCIGSIASVMGHQSRSMTGYQRKQMMYLSIVYYKLNSQMFPFTYLDSSELQEPNGVDPLSQLILLVPYEIRLKLVNMLIQNWLICPV